MFTADVHGVTKVEKIRVERFDPGAGITDDSSGYVTITLRSGRHAETTKFTFFADDVSNVWDQFVEAGVTADAVFMKKYGEKTNG
jgi:hypothetical protein